MGGGDGEVVIGNLVSVLFLLGFLAFIMATATATLIPFPARKSRKNEPNDESDAIPPPESTTSTTTTISKRQQAKED